MSRVSRRKMKHKFRLHNKRYQSGKREDKKRRNPKPYGGHSK